MKKRRTRSAPGPPFQHRMTLHSEVKHLSVRRKLLEPLCSSPLFHPRSVRSPSENRFWLKNMSAICTQRHKSLTMFHTAGKKLLADRVPDVERELADTAMGWVDRVSRHS